MNPDNFHAVILGNGITGITAARHLRVLRPDCRITVISAETEHFFSRTALMYLYMGHMEYHHLKPYEDGFWAKNRIELLHAFVSQIDTNAQQLHYAREFSIHNQAITPGGTAQQLAYDVLLLATGSQYNRFGWPGQDLSGVQGLYGMPDVLQMETNTRDVRQAVIVGGGLIGIEMAEMLRTRDIDVTFLVRETAFWSNVLPLEEAQLIGRHIREHHVDLRLEAELEKILDDGTGRVRAIVTKRGEEIPCQFVGLTTGVSPNVSLAKSAGLDTDRGILVDEFLQTSAPNVYAAGDCTQLRKPAPGQKSVNQIWYTGRIMGETVARSLAGQRTAYQPGVFFNSAKFFDIEYQTYGNVPAKLPEGEQTFYWEFSSGGAARPGHLGGAKALRLNFRADTRALTGVNTFGLRLRHDVCDRWIKTGTPIEEVLENLPAANFDPEFFKQYEPEIVAAFNEQFGTKLRAKAKKGLFANLFS
ncbi:MAG: FAD-dependent oxidoreductase [Cytophagaceae bacterium]|nr:FAD-dependent oxidoreductase [Cytophagaceae bacterium]